MAEKKDQIKNKVEEVKKAVEEAKNKAKEYVEEHPKTSVLVAAGIGLVVGALIGRGLRK